MEKIIKYINNTLGKSDTRVSLFFKRKEDAYRRKKTTELDKLLCDVQKRIQKLKDMDQDYETQLEEFNTKTLKNTNENVESYVDIEIRKRVNADMVTFVERICKKYGLPLSVVMKDIPNSDNFCKGIKGNGKPCTNLVTEGHYCLFHKKVETPHLPNTAPEITTLGLS